MIKPVTPLVGDVCDAGIGVDFKLSPSLSQEVFDCGKIFLVVMNVFRELGSI